MNEVFLEQRQRDRNKDLKQERLVKLLKQTIQTMILDFIFILYCCRSWNKVDQTEFYQDPRWADAFGLHQWLKDANFCYLIFIQIKCIHPSTFLWIWNKYCQGWTEDMVLLYITLSREIKKKKYKYKFIPCTNEHFNMCRLPFGVNPSWSFKDLQYFLLSHWSHSEYLCKTLLWCHTWAFYLLSCPLGAIRRCNFYNITWVVNGLYLVWKKEKKTYLKAWFKIYLL